MEFLAEHATQIAYVVLGITFGTAFPPGQFIRFAICMACYCGAIWVTGNPL